MKDVKFVNKRDGEEEEDEEEEMEEESQPQQQSAKKIKPSKKDSNYELVRIPTSHGYAIQDPDGNVIQYEMMGALVEILNMLRELKKGMVG